MPSIIVSLFAKPLQGVLIVTAIMAAIYFVGREVGIAKIESEV
ncbi:hypothetical protein [Emticicia sp. W12TSBA100-4]